MTAVTAMTGKFGQFVTNDRLVGKLPFGLTDVMKLPNVAVLACFQSNDH